MVRWPENSIIHGFDDLVIAGRLGLVGRNRLEVVGEAGGLEVAPHHEGAPLLGGGGEEPAGATSPGCR